METYVMSKRELDQVYVIKRIVVGELSQKKGAQILGLSVRHVRRKIKRFEEYGEAGIVHKSRGRPSNRKMPKDIQLKILELLETTYKDFGPTFAAEKLAENHFIKVNHETLRRLMINHGLWKVNVRKVPKFSWRDRKECPGELVQVDGSFHIWFNGTYSVLIALIDDATSTVELHFSDGESTKGVSEAMISYLKKHGRPRDLYGDCGGVYRVNNAKDDQPRQTQFVRMLSELDIKMIHAYTPQAKGRVERLFRTLQDRLVKELGLRNITTIEEANKYLQDVFIDQINQKLKVVPKNNVDLHRPVESNLNSIFCIKEVRKLNNDRTIQYKRRWFLLDRKQPVRLNIGCKITVCIAFDGTISLKKENVRLNCKEVVKPTSKPKNRRCPKLLKIQSKSHQKITHGETREDGTKTGHF